MKAGVVTFPGSNCDRDMRVALEAAGADVTQLWHKDTELPELDLVVLPGGFSYGDYLRCGSIAAHSPLLQEVKKHAEKGGYVLGVCNGFQVLAEADLLPGVLLSNNSLKFVCKEQGLSVANDNTKFTRGFTTGEEVMFPIAHHDGNYFADAETIKQLEGDGQVAFRYVGNPNGSINDIAGIVNKQGNVLGMMPHPERAIAEILGGVDGKKFFEYLVG